MHFGLWTYKNKRLCRMKNETNYLQGRWSVALVSNSTHTNSTFNTQMQLNVNVLFYCNQL